MQTDDVVERVKRVLPRAQIEANGEGCNFTVTVISDTFVGKRPVARQQFIMEAFLDMLQSGELHALSIRAWTPEEWQSSQRPISIS